MNDYRILRMGDGRFRIQYYTGWSGIEGWHFSKEMGPFSTLEDATDAIKGARALRDNAAKAQQIMETYYV